MESLKTKTLADIYIRQGHFREAYEILQALAEENPEDKDLKEKLEDLGERLEFSPSPAPESDLSKDEKIRLLQQWLAKIQKRR